MTQVSRLADSMNRLIDRMNIAHGVSRRGRMKYNKTGIRTVAGRGGVLYDCITCFKLNTLSKNTCEHKKTQSTD